MPLPQACLRLAEVDFPIAAVSRHSAREKSIRHGHPSTLHLWWARRPLAACRAMLLALLLPDPADPLCPPEFQTALRTLLPPVQGAPGPAPLDLRHALLKFVGDIANWDLAGNKQYLDVARGLIKAAHPDDTPLVVDPFAGGGSIPLEALRLGCDAFASDLNPVAGLIQKVMLEDIPRYGNAEFKVQNAAGEDVTVQGLAEALRVVGGRIKAEAEKELAQFYPADPDGATPIAYLWARTVRCEAPDCGAEIPLMRSFWLSKKANRRRALRFSPSPSGRGGRGVRAITFEIFEPKTEKDVPTTGTVARAKATCLHCRTVLPPDRVRAQLREQRGGADAIFDEHGQRIGGAMLLAVVTSKQNETGKRYRLPKDQDYFAIWTAKKQLESIESEFLASGISMIPDEDIALTEIRRVSIPLYGCQKWSDVFTARQKFVITRIAKYIREATPNAENSAQTIALRRLLALSLSKQAERSSAFVSWITQTDAPRGTFARQALGFVWDFAEVVPIVENQEYPELLNAMALVAESLVNITNPGQVQSADASFPPLPEQSTQILFTDPPYYDSVPYAHLSDFFYVWLKRIVDDRASFTEELTPKTEECVVDRPHSSNPSSKDVLFYEAKMASAMLAGRKLLADNGLGCVVFAHKTTEGWESLLSGMLKGGLVITASWPVQTERSARLNAQDQAALATSVHLVCRPRTSDDIGDWGDVLRELPKRVNAWIDRLQDEGVRGADLVFACIGPALEIYSRYAQVLDAEDRPIPLGGDPEAKEPHQRGYLAYVWETVARAALERVLGPAGTSAGASALEEDARLTALFLWTLQSTDSTDSPLPMGDGPGVRESADEDDDDDQPSGKTSKGLSLPYDVARRFAQPLGIHLEDWAGRIIATEKGIVRLLPVEDRAAQLFGAEGADAVVTALEDTSTLRPQLTLFPEPPTVRGARNKKTRVTTTVADDALQTRLEATTLDRLHAAMLLQQGGRANALRALLKAEVERGPNFLRLANALSALYPRESEEKRLLDALLLAVPR